MRRSGNVEEAELLRHGGRIPRTEISPGLPLIQSRGMPAKLLRSLLLALLLLPGCRKAKSPAPKPAPLIVKSESLKIEVPALPAGFTAVPGTGDALRLAGPDGGIATVRRGTGSGQGAKGSVELLCQFGQAFLTRDRSPGGDADETIRIFLTSAGRPLVLSYSYPAATSRRERLDQALAVLHSLRAMS
jgi:hypothetical protein